MRTSRLTALLVTAAIATTAGCGGDDKKTSDKAAATTTATTTTATTSDATTTAPSDATPPPPKGSKNDPVPGRTVQAYFNALAKRDGEAACAYMGEEMKRASVAFVTKNLKQKVTTCAAAIEAVIRPAKPADLRKLVNVEIVSSTSAGISATVKVKRATRDALLTKTGDRWLITGGIFDG